MGKLNCYLFVEVSTRHNVLQIPSYGVAGEQQEQVPPSVRARAMGRLMTLTV